jgi:hypothetical protein
MAFVAIKIGRRQGGPSRTGSCRGRILIDAQPTSNLPRRTGLFSSQPFGPRAGWLFFRITNSSRVISDMLSVSASPARTVLKNAQLAGGETILSPG